MIELAVNLCNSVHCIAFMLSETVMLMRRKVRNDFWLKAGGGIQP